MLARERSQIIRVFCHNLLSFLLQVLAEFYLGISSVRNARNDLMAGETVLALLWVAIQGEDKLLARTSGKESQTLVTGITFPIRHYLSDD